MHPCDYKLLLHSMMSAWLCVYTVCCDFVFWQSLVENKHSPILWSDKMNANQHSFSFQSSFRLIFLLCDLFGTRLVNSTPSEDNRWQYWNMSCGVRWSLVGCDTQTAPHQHTHTLRRLSVRHLTCLFLSSVILWIWIFFLPIMAGGGGGQRVQYNRVVPSPQQ